MRRHILLFIVLCLHFSARGQTTYGYRYWFDGDISTAETGSSASDAWSMEVDLSHLKESFHTIHLQVTDEKGVSSAPLTRSFFLSREGGALTNGFYWFDNEVQARTVKGDVQGTLTFDVTELQEGFHTLHYQVKRADGLYSQIETRCFYKMQSDQIVGELTFMCYIDGVTFKQERVSVENGAAVWFLDVSELPIGFHKLQVRAIMQNGASTTNREAFFLREAMPSELNTMKCVCSIDGKVFKQETMQTENGTGLWQIDVSELPIGFHRLQLRAVMENGASTSIREAFFLRNAMDAELEALSCVFSVDGKPYKTIESGMHEGLFHCDLDVAELSDGLHKISYMLTNGKGAQTTVKSQYFIKQPVGGNSIKKYQYWLNDNDDMAHMVVQQEVTDPLKLIALLPVEQQPLRSKLFHFEVKDGKPMMYAKNEFHARFFDAAGRFTDDSDQYIDYNVGQEVTNITNLLPTQTINRPDSNSVKWFSFDVAPGDTAAFKLSQPATVQVFAPSGGEVFKTSESASVKWGGIHTWENGTYYLAVHDVTGSKENMTLEYMHMDKYDVVDWDVHTVGNGGCSTITFKGNGFRDLYAVDLVIAPGDTIHSFDVSHDSDAETAVTFDFTGATLGDYNAVFHFTEEDKHVANVVTVEEAVDIELATTVTYPSTFLRGTSTTYTIKITNKGNMTAYNVPIYTYLMNKNQEDGISHIKFEGLGLRGLLDAIDIDSLSIAERQEVEKLIKEIGDGHYFQHFRVKDENSLNDSIWVKCGYFFTNIAPLETKILRLVVTASEEVIAYVSVPEDWSVFSETKESFSSRAISHSNKANFKENFCCYHEKIECFLDVTSLGADIVEPILLGAAVFTDGATLPAAAIAKWTGCVTSGLSSISSVSATLFCDKDKSFMEKLKEQGVMNTVSVLATVLSCQPGELKALKLGAKFTLKNWKTLLKGGIKWGDNASGFFQCRSNPQNDSNCPPNHPHGGTSTPVNSCEPNDILGYVAESGSKAIREGHTDVFYTIQFENDTVFATAPAHDIYLTDTLDVNLFDLSTYRPTRITIGNKSMELTGERNFISTMDMRPEINAIAQIEGTINDRTGIVRWHISSLDPMTMEPSDDPMVGVLPVNFDGSGLGEASFEISLKPNLPDGTIIPNRSGNVFDNNETVLTPTWTNIVDAVAPSSVIDNSWMVNDSTLRITADGFDERSGVWKYTWYVQAGENAPWWNEGETESPQFDYHIYEGIDYGFCVLATDSAGNVEQKVIQRERGFKTYGQDYEDGISPLPTSPKEEEPVYDLSGRQIENGKSLNRKHRKGVIIRNRKKTLVTE